MAKSNFTNLEINKLAEDLADLIWDTVLNWDGFAKRTIGEQMVRAADSISANIAEGAGRGSFQDNRRFILIARGSLYETQNWLRRSYKRRLLKENEIEKTKKLIEELLPRLNAYLNSLTKRKKNS